MKKILLSLILTSSYLIIFSQIAPEIEWQNTIGGSAYDGLYVVKQTTDGGYILGGYSTSDASGDKSEDTIGDPGTDYEDYWVVKLDTNGTIEWENTIGGNRVDKLSSIQQCLDGGFIMGGQSNSDASGDKTEDTIGENFQEDYWVVKLDPNGTIEWDNTVGGDDVDELRSVYQTADGGFILGGHSDSDASGDKTEDRLGWKDYWIVKLDMDGEVQWQNTIGGSDYDLLESIDQTTDGGYILGGFSRSNISGDKDEDSLGERDYWVVKLNPNGDIVWQNTIGGGAADLLWDVHQTMDQGYILGGYSYSNISGDKTEDSNGINDYWVVKLNPNGDIEWQNTIGGSDADELRSIKQTIDGGYILGGYSYSDISGDKTEDSNGLFDYWVIKLDNSGSIIWQNSIGGSADDFLNCVQQTSDNGFILGGSTDSGISGDHTEYTNGSYDYWIVKLEPEMIGVNENQMQDINIYPNPVNELLYVDFDEEIQIEIVNILGKNVLARSNQKKINVGQLAKGVYLIQIFDINHDLLKTSKFLKE